MKYLPLIWRNLLRRKVRTIFTLASIFIAFVLYSFLMVVQNAFSMGIDMAGADRLMLMHKTGLIQLLPISYQQQIASTPGVTHVSNASWAKSPELLSAKRVEVEVALLPLLQRRFQLVRLNLIEPVIALETNAKGQGNWQPAESRSEE